MTDQRRTWVCHYRPLIKEKKFGVLVYKSLDFYVHMVNTMINDVGKDGVTHWSTLKNQKTWIKSVYIWIQSRCLTWLIYVAWFKNLDVKKCIQKVSWKSQMIQVSWSYKNDQSKPGFNRFIFRKSLSEIRLSGREDKKLENLLSTLWRAKTLNLVQP